MSKKVKILIIIAVVVTVLAVAAVFAIKWYNQQEYAIVSKQFDVSISKNAELIYFDDDTDYCHAAYGIGEDDYKALLDKIDSVGYKEVEVETELPDLEWIPADRIVKGYELVVYGESAEKIFITDLTNGYVELYFVKQ